MIKIEQYKIFHPDYGLYSKGGIYAHLSATYWWSKKGKLWTSAGALRRHLFQYVERQGENVIPEEWEVHMYATNDQTGQVELTVFNAKKFYDKTHLQ